ncbi:uncharacterized protein DUF4157 [Chitinophaga niastensis]|uniref:Uncharacterized protein DUF4157 n=1 Tax=Chitinophaga niastensis TaxID=536980 RepID=A0A2P8HGN1_CHINA|nr:DUF4157 domain-containing protein [Chitinophaga niastensis]PSL45376.1 uncharacterized protein DUF4157 [Chitinophaga niastensis]
MQQPRDKALPANVATSHPVAQEANATGIALPAVDSLQRMKANNTGLPDTLKNGVEALSGFAMNDVRVHYNSDKPAQLHALAYAQGPDIHIGPGQERHLPHEAWHVVQQKQGRVQATIQTKSNVNINDDAGLEAEADVMGAKANTVTQHKSDGTMHMPSPMLYNNTVQLALTTMGGKWTAGKYALTRNLLDVNDVIGYRGVEMQLVFEPGDSVDAKQIVLTQAVKTHKDNSPYITPKENYAGRTVEEGKPGAGYRIDNDPYHVSPVYHSTGLEGETAKEGNRTLADTTFGSTEEDLRSGFAGYHYIAEDSGELEKCNAGLVDSPSIEGAKKNSGHTFETTALATEGKDTGTYYGSVEWGWKTDNAGQHTLLDFKVLSNGTPTQNFVESAKVWNKQSVKFTDAALESLRQGKIKDPAIFKSVKRMPPKDAVFPTIKLPIPTQLDITWIKEMYHEFSDAPHVMEEYSSMLMDGFQGMDAGTKATCIAHLKAAKTAILKGVKDPVEAYEIKLLVQANKINDFVIVNGS